MVSLFKQNTITTAAAVVFMAIVLKSALWIHPPLATEMQGFDRVFRQTFIPLTRGYMEFKGVYFGLSVLFTMLWALYVNHVSNNEKLFARSNFFPAMLVVVLSSFPRTAQLLSLPFLAHALVFIALDKTFKLSATTKPQRKIYDIGFLVAAAGLCYPPAWIFLPFFLFFIRTVRALRGPQLSAYIFGLTTPFYFYLAYVVSTGRWTSTRLAVQQQLKFLPKFTLTPTLIALGVVVIALWIYSQMRSASPQWQPTAVARKKWQVLQWFMLPALFCAVWTPHTPGMAWMFVVSPFSLLCSLCFIQVKEKYNTFTFYFLMVAMLLMVWLL